MKNSVKHNVSSALKELDDTGLIKGLTPEKTHLRNIFSYVQEVSDEGAVYNGSAWNPVEV